jgi:hypothetical protein
MRKTFSLGLLCAFPLTFSASGEIVCALGPGASSYNASLDQRPTGDAMQLAGRVNTALASTCSPKCPQIAVFRNATAPNAMLFVSSDQAKIVYAPQFFATLHDNYGDGAIIAIVAHEYGHALDETYPAKWMKNGWTPEIRADGWAGCALAKSDLSSRNLREALTAVSKYPPLPPVGAHPTWAQRLPALRLGYIHCGGDGSKFDSWVPHEVSLP